MPMRRKSTKSRKGGGTRSRRTSYKSKGKAARSSKVTASKLLLSGSRLVDMEIRKNHRVNLGQVMPLCPSNGAEPPVYDASSIVAEQVFEPIPWKASDGSEDGAGLSTQTHFKGYKGFYKSITMNLNLYYKNKGTATAGTQDAIRYRIMAFSIKQDMQPDDICILGNLDRSLTSARDMSVMPRVLYKKEGVLNDSKDIERIVHTVNIGRFVSRRQPGSERQLGYDGTANEAAAGLSTSVNQTERVFLIFSTDAPGGDNDAEIECKGFIDALGYDQD